MKILRGHGEQPVGMGKTVLRGQTVVVEFWQSHYSNNTWTVVLVIPAGGDDLMMCTVSSGRDWRGVAVIE